MKKKFMGVGTLALLQIAIVGNLQPLSANALQGFSLPILYLLAVLGFFAPCVLMVAELATTHPQTGGAYIWVEKAFGKQAGFFTVCLLWIANFLWYPSLFAFIATNFAYLFSPALAKNTIFIASVSSLIFWGITLLNCFGIRLSSLFSSLSAVMGILVPLFLIVMAGMLWLVLGHPLAIPIHSSSFLHSFHHSENLSYVIAIVMSLFGIELSAVHAGNVLNPKYDYPRSLLISSLILILGLIAAALSIAIILPPEKMNIVSSLLEALILFFKKTHLEVMIWPVLLLVFLGSLGSAAAWMLSSTRSMFVACQHNHVIPLLQKTNRFDSPTGVLLFEAIIFTVASTVMLCFPRISDSFWLFLDVASQISLIYYAILFISCIRLRNPSAEKKGFLMPGGKIGLWGLMSLGTMTSLFALLIGFIAPSTLSSKEAIFFDSVLVASLIFSLTLPWILLKWGKLSRR